MIKRIKTEDCECWAIVFNKCYSLEDIGRISHGLIELMTTATQSDLFDNSQQGFFAALELLQEIIPNSTQMFEYEKMLQEKGLITSWTKQGEK